MSKIKRLLRHDLPLHFVLLFTNWLPDNVFFIRLRGSLARPFFKKCGKRLGIGRNVTFYNPSKISIGNDVYIAYGCWFGGDITIEDEVLFGPYCVLAPSNHQKDNGSFRFAKNTIGRIIIEKGSWMASHSLVIGNTILKKGTILGANSLLTKDSDPDSIYAGSPARKIERRNE